MGGKIQLNKRVLYSLPKITSLKPKNVEAGEGLGICPRDAGGTRGGDPLQIVFQIDNQNKDLLFFHIYFTILLNFTTLAGVAQLLHWIITSFCGNLLRYRYHMGSIV